MRPHPLRPQGARSGCAIRPPKLGTRGHVIIPSSVRPYRPRSRDGMEYGSYGHLLFERREHGVLLITLNRPEVYNAADEAMHSQLARVWTDIARDDQTRVGVITGAGKAFSAGGDLAMVQRMAGDYDRTSHMLTEMSDLVYNMVNCDKPIVSAINGVAVGAGLVIALLADISICAADARLGDGHVRLGAAAGGHCAIIWPLLGGMATARYYLLTGEMVDGVEAERIGLVSRVLPRDQVLDEALRVAGTLAQGSQLAIRLTKRAMNGWLRTAGPIFDQSAAYEMLTFMGPAPARGGGRAAGEAPAEVQRTEISHNGRARQCSSAGCFKAITGGSRRQSCSCRSRKA